MTLLTLRPNSTTSILGAVTGAANAHTALSDNTDASYVTYDAAGNEDSSHALTDLTLPAGAVIKSTTLRARMASAAGTTALLSIDNVAPAPTSYMTVNSATPTTYQGTPVVGFTDANLDAAILTITNVGLTNALIAYEAYVDVRVVNQPTVTVSAPTGTVTNTNQPTVTWTPVLDSDGGPQADVEVKIFSAAQYGAGGFDPSTSTPTVSGAVNSAATSWQVTTPLANATYRAYVRVAQTVNNLSHWSAWAFSGFIENVAIPAVPTMTLTGQSASGRTQIVVNDNSGTATTTALEIQRLEPDGVTWVGVRSAYSDTGLIVLTDATIYDYEGPLGTVTSYRARALHDYSGVYAASAWTSTGTVTLTGTQWWLKHPNRPALNMAVTPRSYRAVQRAARQGVFPVLGGTLPVVVSDTRGGATGSVTLLVATLTTLLRLEVLLDSVGVMFLQGPAAHGEPDRYVVIGSQDSSRVIDSGGVAVGLKRDVTLGWVETRRPAGVITGAEWVA